MHCLKATFPLSPPFLLNPLEPGFDFPHSLLLNLLQNFPFRSPCNIPLLLQLASKSLQILLKHMVSWSQQQPDSSVLPDTLVKCSATVTPRLHKKIRGWELYFQAQVSVHPLIFLDCRGVDWHYMGTMGQRKTAQDIISGSRGIEPPLTMAKSIPQRHMPSHPLLPSTLSLPSGAHQFSLASTSFHRLSKDSHYLISSPQTHMHYHKYQLWGTPHLLTMNLHHWCQKVMPISKCPANSVHLQGSS